MKRKIFNPTRNEKKRMVVRAVAEFLQPYRSLYGYRHEFVTNAYRNLLPETEYADPSLMHELQLLRLKKILRIAETIPWWRDRLEGAGIQRESLTALSVLERLPPVSKQSFTNTSRAELLAPAFKDRERLVLFRTSGTTGAPFEWGGDRNTSFVESASYFHRILVWHGISPKRDGRRPFIASFTGPTTAQPSVACNWSPVETNADQAFQNLLDQITTGRYRVLYIYPTNLLLFAKKLAESRQKLPFQLVVAGGQRLDDDSREYAEKVLGCPVVATYGSTEVGQIAIECPKLRHHYHVHAERLFLEITDEQGRRLPDGEEGLITLTSLENRALPLLRYHIGDRGRIVPEKCPCGRTLPLLAFSGKQMDFIRFPSGKIAPFRQINRFLLPLFFDEIEFYQIMQPTLGQLVIRVKLRHGDKQSFESRFSNELYKHIGTELSIVFEYPALWGAGSEGKMRMFVPLR